MQLSAASGQARCGQCKTQFNALEALLDKAPSRNDPTVKKSPPAQNIDLKNTQVSPNLDNEIEQLDRDFDPISEVKALGPTRRTKRSSDSLIVEDTLDALDFTPEQASSKRPNHEIQSMDLDEFSLDLSDDKLSDIDLSHRISTSRKQKPTKTSQTPALAQNTQNPDDGFLKDLDTVIDEEGVFKNSDRAMMEDQSSPTVFKEEGSQASPSSSYISQELGARNRPSSLLSNVLWVGLISLLVLVLIGQLIYFKRVEFSQSPSMRPFVEIICNNLRPLTECSIPDARDIEGIELTERDVRSHPQRENTLLITASIVNNAAFVQPFPKMIMRFTDINQQPIADRLFEPQEYLSPEIDLSSGMQPGIPVKVKLEIIDPGSNAVSFEFDFK